MYFLSHMEKRTVMQQAGAFSESPQNVQHQMNAMRLGCLNILYRGAQLKGVVSGTATPVS